MGLFAPSSSFSPHRHHPHFLRPPSSSTCSGAITSTRDSAGLLGFHLTRPPPAPSPRMVSRDWYPSTPAPRRGIDIDASFASLPSTTTHSRSRGALMTTAKLIVCNVKCFPVSALMCQCNCCGHLAFLMYDT